MEINVFDSLNSTLVIVIPLLAGLVLIGTSAVVVVQHPDFTSSHWGIIVVGALLCVAPTLATLNLKAPGIEVIAAVKQVGETQTNQLAAQGAKVNRDLADLQKQVDELSKKAGVSAPTTAEAESQQKTRRTTILIFYVEKKKSQAINIEQYLLDKGYTANAVMTDFSELPDASRLPADSISIVYSNAELANAVKQTLRSKFPELNRIIDSLVPKLASGDVQIRLF
jgi:hypothetical protein